MNAARAVPDALPFISLYHTGARRAIKGLTSFFIPLIDIFNVMIKFTSIALDVSDGQR